jgi:formylglycine-generating enzyme required for sulfatase activity
LDVASGTYFRSYTAAKPTSYADAATISAFRLDKYLVTVGRFRQFVNAWNAGYRPAQGAGKHSHLNAGQGLQNSAAAGGYEPGWDAARWNYTANLNPTCGSPADTWTAAPSSQEKLPINCVDWWEAAAFCVWDGGFLPSEAEWEYAAAGGSEQRQYPWGATAPGMANQYAIYGDGESACYYPSGTAANCAGIANIAPVGFAAKGAGRFGQLDLVGEVFEWNLDFYAKYAACTDCAYLGDTANRVMRGDLLNNQTTLSPANRFDVNPAFRAVNLGFRCARAPGTTTSSSTSGAATVTMTGTAAGASAPGMSVPVAIPGGCSVPSPVSFKKDVQPFLEASCGKTGAANASNGGCHVLDNQSTLLEGGKDHAFDWITGTAHDTSCPETPTPLRFQVVMAVMQQANPASCSKSGIMPAATTPPRAPLSACQIAILQSWLNESYLTQFHRYDGISPTTPYAMPPWN